ncbi:hypothetical protein [Arsenicibacter rosenii]|uniref:Secretion system C-terminal sorting domain-containing protein n=1 Tax=Arsenicibacter rosenii TaxID=1750698 RepID=A0A1S2VIG9_9BACT|nr:hypothetical protein [Arsenicibacter rosenii]OIN57648.1 hypothetical protein BLX24_18020 [Arsenicibacter rosenii]
MKTLRQSFGKALLVATCVAVSSWANAQAKASTETYYEAKPEQNLALAMYPASDPSKLWMVVEKGIPAKRLTMRIMDSKQKVVYESDIYSKKTTFRQRFDLSELADGLYTFQISDGKQIQERSFKLATPGITETLPQRNITMN